MRYFALQNGHKGDLLGLVQFDDENMVTAYWNATNEMWVPSKEFDIDVVSGMDTDAREVDEAEAEKLKGVLAAL